MRALATLLAVGAKSSLKRDRERHPYLLGEGVGGYEFSLLPRK
jgi:hypothetical protein